MEKFDKNFIQNVCKDIFELTESGYSIGIVVGGGNIMRGSDLRNLGIGAVKSDHVGMLATAINGIVIQDMLRSTASMKVDIFSAVSMGPIVKLYNIDEVLSSLKEKRVAIFVGGVGAPFFTTDTGAVLRGIEIGAEAILKGTQVDGVYSSDPSKNADAIRYDSVSYSEVLSKKLRVMDSTAISLAMNHSLKIRVFNVHEEGMLKKVAGGDGFFSEIYL